ncbi:uncharacterized protein LOC135842431 isoform X2 [Planococcus citri]|uniref:uncharacterized protein LOC135842431 isoform X2 n=1 Tax=Planococcus citri TaxID=170843 RepID=UPI0031F940AA
MNDKLFSHLIMAHFLSGWWSVLGENSNDDDDTLDSKDLRVLKMVTDNPDLYKVLRDRLISLNTFKELYFNEEGENRNYYAGNNMNFKLFFYLIMAHLVSGRWSVLGENSNDELLNSNDQEILKLVTENPGLHRAFRENLIVGKLKQDLNFFKGLYNDEKQKNMDNGALHTGYLKYVQGIKIHDWIVDLETKFPIWLSDLEVDRFIKWVLALKFVEGPIFDDIRNRIKKFNIKVEEFANEMDSMFEETTSLFAGNLPGIPIPKHNEILHLCEIISRGKEEIRKAACNILLSTISGDRIQVSTCNKASSTADTYPTKCYVIITEYKTLYTDAEIGFNDVLQKVKSNSEFKQQNCSIGTRKFYCAS